MSVCLYFDLLWFNAHRFVHDKKKILAVANATTQPPRSVSCDCGINLKNPRQSLGFELVRDF